MRHCPHCGVRLSPEEEITDMERRIRAFCRAHGIVIRFDDSISEAGYADLRDRSRNTIKNERLCGRGAVSFRDPNGWNRYFIVDLAVYMLGKQTG